MRVFAIDPGTTQTGYAVMDGLNVLSFGIKENTSFLRGLDDRYHYPSLIMAYEMVACYGMPVGAEVFETCVWIGRFIERFRGVSKPIYRCDVKHHLCNSVKAKDSNVRQAILDKYPATGGGKTPQVGTKSNPGPLYGVSSHVWPAIGVGLTAQNL